VSLVCYSNYTVNRGSPTDSIGGQVSQRSQRARQYRHSLMTRASAVHVGDRNGNKHAPNASVAGANESGTSPTHHTLTQMAMQNLIERLGENVGKVRGGWNFNNLESARLQVIFEMMVLK
jgi:hypothetical protein